MRKLLTVGLVSFAAAAFAAAGLSQPRRPAPRRPPTPQVAAAPAGPPSSPRIAQELGQIRWGATHDQVLDYYRGFLRAQFQPRLKNLGMLEQARVVEQRESAIRAVERTYVEFDGAQAHRGWDSSFVGEEYTHGNNESMLVYEDARGNREFFFFINDRLWKRVQARNTGGARIDFDDFSAQLEALFGPGRRVMDGTRLRTVEWQDEATRLHVVDNTTFFSAFCLVYQEVATLSQLAALRRNTLPGRQQRAAVAQVEPANPGGATTTSDPNSDIVDRITGKIRRIPANQAGASASASSSAGAARGASVTPPAGSPGPAGASGRADAGTSLQEVSDPLGGLGL